MREEATSRGYAAEDRNTGKWPTRCQIPDLDLSLLSRNQPVEQDRTRTLFLPLVWRCKDLANIDYRVPPCWLVRPFRPFA